MFYPLSKLSLAAILAFVILCLGLTTPYVLGAPGAYLQIVCALLATLILLVRHSPLALPGDSGFKLFALAFILPVVAFALTAHGPRDVLPAFNFAMLLFWRGHRATTNEMISAGRRLPSSRARPSAEFLLSRNGRRRLTYPTTVVAIKERSIAKKRRYRSRITLAGPSRTGASRGGASFSRWR